MKKLVDKNLITNHPPLVKLKNPPLSLVEKYFKIDQFGSTIKKEIVGGLSTFLALAYILSVNPSILANTQSISGADISYFGLFLSTALVSFFCTFLMGIFANVPIVLTTTMGMNTLFTYSIAKSGLGFEGAMLTVLFSAILFTIVAITPLRTLILAALPKSLVKGFTLALGFFVAYVGLQQIFWVATTENGLPIAALSKLKETYPMVLLGTVTLVLIIIFNFLKIPGGVAISLFVGFLIAAVIANTLPADSILVKGVDSPFYNINFRNGFAWKYDFSGFAANIKNGWSQIGNLKIWSNPLFYVSILIVSLMSLFSEISILETITYQLKAENNVKWLNKCLIIDSSTSIVNGIFGVSSLGAAAESMIGVNQGSKTGLSAITTSLMFLFAIPLYPIFKLIPTFISGAACFFIGIMIVNVINKIEWEKPEILVSVFLTVIFTMTTFTLVNGVAMGIITYNLMMVLTKKIKEVSWVLWLLSLIMIGYFIATAFIQK